jgi:hypothetical protein
VHQAAVVVHQCLTLLQVEDTPSSSSSSMQAIVVKKTGGLDVLELMQDYPLPEQKTGQVIAAASR